ncbi:uncharacterized protein BcabD6B2_56510 [Babesia caballi]|uniref:Membrane protein, putative n=1 Tax=Babesia caballi TaxID=5871 RepID=A0AAV4M2X8_BABCB|nr:membrane protein, putative [Babesia caballi]
MKAFLLLSAVASLAFADAKKEESPIVSLTKKEFNVTIPEYSMKVLSCPSGTGLTIEQAFWVAKFSGKLDVDSASPIKLTRTNEVTAICRGLNNCVLRPIAHLDKVINEKYHFFGVPFSNASYELQVKGICTSTARVPSGREVIASIDPTRNMVMGCNEGEVIALSYFRGAGIFRTWQYRHNYCNRSFVDQAFEKCYNQRSCTIDKALYTEDKICEYQVIDAQYYCRPAVHHAYVDIQKDSSNGFEIILTAEEDSRVSVKAPAGSVLSVMSAVWDVVGKLQEDNDPKRNRLDLLQFYCEGRSSCTFIPKRTSNGMLELHLGGITTNIQKPMVLMAKFKVVKSDNKIEDTNVHHVECKKGGSITMNCPSGRHLRVVTALWGGPVTSQSREPMLIFWEETVVDGKPYRTTEIGAFLERRVFNKTEYTFDPFAVVDDKPVLPLINGVKDTDHSLSVNYTCMDFSKTPSITDLKLSEIKSVGMDYDAQEYQLEKENILDFSFQKNNLVLIMLEQSAKSTVQVGNFLTIEVPAAPEDDYQLRHKDNVLVTRKFGKNSDNVVISILFADADLIHVTTNFYEGGQLVETYADEALYQSFNYGEDIKDIVVATGGVLGMRMFFKES